MAGYVYILRSEKSGRYYIGSTIHPERRLAQHNSNIVAATRNKGPWEMLKLVEFADARLAARAEMLLKRLKGKRIIEQVVSDAFVWPPDLAAV